MRTERERGGEKGSKCQSFLHAKARHLISIGDFIFPIQTFAPVPFDSNRPSDALGLNLVAPRMGDAGLLPTQRASHHQRRAC